MKRSLKFPSEAKDCTECVYYSEILKYCLKFKKKIEDPKLPPCKPKGYFIYKRLDRDTLLGELCIHDIAVLSRVIPLKPGVRIGEILDTLEKVGCKPIESKRVGDSSTLYLSCPCTVKVELKCTKDVCMYKVLPK
ncbi:MAG: hypothetical protein GXO07_05085 [Crenarchaeota archaeon]|nr:hypothetical protein [Thermoproteota archaeon]